MARRLKVIGRILIRFCLLAMAVCSRACLLAAHDAVKQQELAA